MTGCRPDIPPQVADIIRHLPPDVKRGVKAAIRAIAENPALGEPLQRKLDGLCKYRVKRFRIVYAVDRSRKCLRIVAVGHRRTVYEEIAERARRRR